MRCADHITPAEKLGYTEWHDRAHEWEKARKKKRLVGGGQVQCGECNKWFFPWERRGWEKVLP